MTNQRRAVTREIIPGQGGGRAVVGKRACSGSAARRPRQACQPPGRADRAPRFVGHPGGIPRLAVCFRSRLEYLRHYNMNLRWLGFCTEHGRGRVMVRRFGDRNEINTYVLLEH